MLASSLSLTGIVIAAVVFVVLYVILSVALWVSLLAAAGTLLVFTLVSGGTAAANRRGQPGH